MISVNEGGTMRRLASRLLIIAGLCTGGPVLAQDKPLVVELWPGQVPDEVGNIGEEKVVMSPKLDRKQVEVTEPTRMVTNVSRPTITIYRPAKDKDTGTAVLICPGGGYWNLYWQLEGEEVAAWLNSLGVTGIILKYRVPRRPDEPKGEPARRPLQDAQRAVSLVRSKAEEWGIDPQRIGIVGFSAGGHLALATAIGFEKRTYEPVDDIDKISCRPDFAILCYSGYLKAKDKDELAPGLRIPAGNSPDLSGARRGRHHQRPRSQRGHVPGPEASRHPGGVARLRNGRPRLRCPPKRPSMLHLDAGLCQLAAAPGIAQGERMTAAVSARAKKRLAPLVLRDRFSTCRPCRRPEAWQAPCFLP